MIILLLAVIVAIIIAAVFMRKNQEKREMEDRLREIEEERAKEREARMAEEAEEQRKMKEHCEELNKIYHAEMEAWESRFCSEANPGIKIAGINKQNLTERYLGAFKGTLKAEDWNAFDSKAIAIYRGQKKVGYIPKEFSAIVFAGLKNGKGLCYGCIYKWVEPGIGNSEDEYYAGKVVLSSTQETE